MLLLTIKFYPYSLRRYFRLTTCCSAEEKYEQIKKKQLKRPFERQFFQERIKLCLYRIFITKYVQ